MIIRTGLRATALAASVAIAIACANGQGQEAYSLRRMYKAGQSDAYRFDVNIKGSGGQPGAQSNMAVSLVTTETIKEVRPDGGVTVETRLDSGSALIGGSKVDLPMNGQVITATLDASGKVTKQEGGGPFAGLANMAAMGSALPAQGDRKFRAGEEIKFDTPTNSDGTKRMKGVATVLGLQKAGGDLAVPTVKVHTVADGTVPGAQGDQNVHIDVTSYLEPGTGKILKLSGTVSGVNVGMMPNATLTLTRVRITAPEAKQPAAK